MKKLQKLIFLLPAILFSSGFYSQIGIDTATPDPSSVLELFSTGKGFLMPRLTTIQRDNMMNPANGLMIYNTTLNDGQINTGTPSAPSWHGIKTNSSPTISSVNNSDDTTTTSKSDLIISGMSITAPSSGNYLVLFNGQMSSSNTQKFSSTQAISDIKTLYNQLIAYPGSAAHALVFGNGEVLKPGVYDVTGAMSVSGTLTLDGSGDENSIFIMRSTGAFATVAGSNVTLTGNARPENIFWVSEGAPSTGANSALSGTLIHGSTSAGAISMGANSSINGRMFTTLGAASLAAGCVLTTPVRNGPFSLGVLSTFAMWTSSGAITSEADSTITGNVGTGAGSTAGMSGDINGQIYQPNTSSTISTPTATNFTIFQNGNEVPHSARTINASNALISLQSMVTVNAGDPIDIRWNIVDGTAAIDNRILTLIPSGS